jgi:hypothetical protein
MGSAVSVTTTTTKSSNEVCEEESIKLALTENFQDSYKRHKNSKNLFIPGILTQQSSASHVLSSNKKRCMLDHVDAKETKQWHRATTLDILKRHPCHLQRVSYELKNDPEIVYACVSRNGKSLQYASDELKNNFGIALAAVTQIGTALKYASPELRADRQLVLTAIENDELAIQFSSKSLHSDIIFLLQAVVANPYVLNTKMCSKYKHGDSTLIDYVQEHISRYSLTSQTFVSTFLWGYTSPPSIQAYFFGVGDTQLSDVKLCGIREEDDDDDEAAAAAITTTTTTTTTVHHRRSLDRICSLFILKCAETRIPLGRSACYGGRVKYMIAEFAGLQQGKHWRLLCAAQSLLKSSHI